mmetsp:Transcript_2076/g.3805  ORF Transcript_2076/g.3805 Transcript_2076/m.3805 type:complete len:226 (+) Transcript_2076:67-744(+)
MDTFSSNAHYYCCCFLNEVTLSTSSCGRALSCMNCRIYRMASVPRSVASIPSMDLPRSRSGGKCLASFLFPSSTMSIISCKASRSFIFIKGHVAQPPAVEHPSPPATPGTMGSSLTLASFPPSSVVVVVMTASELTGNIISASMCAPLLLLFVVSNDAVTVCPKISCTFLTMDVTIPASVPKTNRSRCCCWLCCWSCCWLCCCVAASWTLRVIKFKISDVDPTTP